MAEKLAERANYALSNNTKSNYRTVKNNVVRCEEAMDVTLDFPWNIKKTLCFVAYLLFTRCVKAKTVECQLAGVRMAHLQLGFDSPTLKKPIVDLILKGTEHWEVLNENLSNTTHRTPVTIDMMKVIKRKLHQYNWAPDIKFQFWATCTLVWAGSLRIHEVLSKNQSNFDPQTTLLSNNIEIVSVDCSGLERQLIRLKIKSPKEDRVGHGTTLEIFGNDTFLCPVRALKKYMKTNGHMGNSRQSKPFFMWPSGKGYTGTDFNKHLKEMTIELTVGTDKVVRSHSL